MISLPRAKLKVTTTNWENHIGGNTTMARTVQVKAERTVFDFLEMIKRALDFASIRDRAIILATLQGGMDDSTLAEAFNYLAYPQLAKHFGSEDWNEWDVSTKCPARVILVRPKSTFRHYTFQDVDAIQTKKEWLDIRPGPGLKTYPPDMPEVSFAGMNSVFEYGMIMGAIEEVATVTVEASA